ncbi:hypothetical protein WMY93_017646 [Mugilogobius chulae]|uniref:Uncharacterized protein n=1 Tax=Mugilogobius chulae TaxID=88201 RepID=A0AAW0NT90_9GOBI
MVSVREGFRLPHGMTLYDLHQGDSYAPFRKTVEIEMDRQVADFNKGAVGLTYAMSMIVSAGADDRQQMDFLTRLNFSGNTALAARWAELTPEERRKKISTADLAVHLSKNRKNKEVKETVRRVSKNGSAQPQSAGKATAEAKQSQGNRKLKGRREWRGKKKGTSRRRDQSPAPPSKKDRPKEKQNQKPQKAKDSWIPREQWKQMTSDQRDRARGKNKKSANTCVQKKDRPRDQNQKSDSSNQKKGQDKNQKSKLQK